MPNKIILKSGTRFGKLIVKSEDDKRTRNGGVHYLCLCDCGNIKVCSGASLRIKQTVSCGCLREDRGRNVNKSHGEYLSPAYRIWAGMKQRCSENCPKRSYNSYYGKGIRVCPDWIQFEGFLEDMGQPPKGMSLDRIDNDLGYSKSNCRWATDRQQAQNTSKNVWIEWQGKKMVISEAARLIGCDYKTVTYRIKSGWPISKIFTTPGRK